MSDRFKIGDRVYWSTASRRIRATVIETSVPYDNNGLSTVSPRNDGVKVETDPTDRNPSWGEQPYPAVAIWPEWSERLKHIEQRLPR